MERPKKGKGKAEGSKGYGDGWEIVGGAGRCIACVKSNAQCVINTGAIDNWRVEMAAGKHFKRNPPGTNCRRCRGKKHACYLPATAELREAMKKGREASVALSASSTTSDASSVTSAASRVNLKRRLEVEIKQPIKRRREAMPDKEQPSELLRAVLRLEESLGRIEQMMKMRK